MTVQVLTGDCLEVLRTLPDESVHCCVTSPPYFGLRDYGMAGQIGVEETPAEYVERVVTVLREVWRVLRSDGTLWLNLGDSYAGAGPSGASYQSKTTVERADKKRDGKFAISATLAARGLTYAEKKPVPPPGLKSKDLVGVPWMVAFAARADGWWLRQDIVWHKPNPMPESVNDRCTKAHEYIFLLTKRERYYYDAEAIAEPLAYASIERLSQPTIDEQRGSDRVPGKTNGTMKAVYRKPSGAYQQESGRNDGNEHLSGGFPTGGETRNKRSVWTVTTKPYSGAHFATFPPDLIEPCILAGCPVGGTVLDPFGGAGTTGLVADRLQRNAILIELNPAYADMARDRITRDAGMFADVS